MSIDFEGIIEGRAIEVLTPIMTDENAYKITDIISKHHGGRKYLEELSKMSNKLFEERTNVKNYKSFAFRCGHYFFGVCASAAETFIKNSQSLEEDLLFVHGLGCLQDTIDRLLGDWENNLELLRDINKIVSKNPKMNVKVDTYFIMCDTNPEDIEQRIKLLMKFGLGGDDHLTQIVDYVFHPDMVNHSLFISLAHVREVHKRNPNWKVDFAGSDGASLLRLCVLGLYNYECDDPLNISFIERLVSEGYWTPEILQKHIDRINILDGELVAALGKFIAKHPEWKLRINLKTIEDAFELGAENVTIKGKPVIDSLELAQNANQMMKFFNSKL
jgi:hypothetical protein